MSETGYIFIAVFFGILIALCIHRLDCLKEDHDDLKTALIEKQIIPDDDDDDDDEENK